MTTKPEPSGKRVQRKPVGYRNRFEVSNKDPNFAYRIVADRPGRIQEFLDAGYVIEDKETTKLGADRIEGSNSLAAKHSISLGAGDIGVLMKIPKEYYEEDQQTKLNEVRQREAALKQSFLKQDGTNYGDIKVS